ncbi:hypothetical protein ASE85_04830 [Sphingobium sp. Leaf26]|uniref:hypothetical protein n=1 Tax=Sphingobium sp. Leaf26 TaxID=1735693 RepID=UPI0006F8A840|nr:hypothetical protein [Sphingobium sp. Leaf26]KQN04377.1 hypothetical protein ASE85_04830 [Sphingobium sp. Leaf26]
MAKDHDSDKLDASGLRAAAREGDLEPFLKRAQQSLDDQEWAELVAETVGAHRAGEIDFIAALTAENDERTNYATQRFLELGLPQLDVTLVQILDLLTALSHRDSRQGIPYYLVEGFGGWCEAAPARPLAAIAAIRSGEAPIELLRATLLAGLRVDRVHFLPFALRLLHDGNAEEYTVAASLLGLFEAFTGAELDQAVTGLEQALQAGNGPSLAPTLRALLAIALRVPERESTGLAALDAVADRADAGLREAIATELMFARDKLSPALGRAALPLLRDTQPNETSAIDAIDHMLSQHLHGPLAPEMTALLDHLLAERVTKIKALDSTRYAIYQDADSLLTATVARWLVSERLAHTRAVKAMCRNVAGDPLEFTLDFSGYGLNAIEAERIGRRCCALLMVYPETLASILASLLRTGPSEAGHAIEQLIVNPLLITYWIGPRRTLERLLPTADTALAAALTRIFAAHDDYKTGIEAVRRLPELQPSSHHRFLVATMKREEQQKIAKAAHRESILGSLMSTSILLYGDSAIYEMHVEPGKTVRQETPLVSRRYSHELPRLDVIDPLGSWYQRTVLLRDEGDE